MSSWFKDGGETFTRSLQRRIDRETLVDLLGLIECIANRDSQLEDLGVFDKTDVGGLLFDYVLDALGAPTEGFEYDSQTFSRIGLEEMFYMDFVFDKKYASVSNVLATLDVEADDAARQWNYGKYAQVS